MRRQFITCQPNKCYNFCPKYSRFLKQISCGGRKHFFSGNPNAFSLFYWDGTSQKRRNNFYKATFAFGNYFCISEDVGHRLENSAQLTSDNNNSKLSIFCVTYYRTKPTTCRPSYCFTTKKTVRKSLHFVLLQVFISSYFEVFIFYFEMAKQLKQQILVIRLKNFRQIWANLFHTKYRLREVVNSRLLLLKINFSFNLSFS